MQQSRRGNPYPFTWEIPLGVLLAVVSLLVCGAQLGRTLANLITGSGWVFVPRERFFTSLLGVLSGDPRAGLGPLAHPASAVATWAWIAAVEGILVAGCAVAGKAALDRWGPTRVLGMATRHEAERLMGRTRLRKSATVVRPDRYGPERTR